MKIKVLVSTTVAFLALVPMAQAQDTLSLYNWSAYIDPEVLDGFTAETGIEVALDTFSSNEEMLAKVIAGASGYDVVVPSAWMQDIMINQGLLQSIQFSSLTGHQAVDEAYLVSEADSEQEFCVPYNWGTTGLMYNRDLVGGVDMETWEVIFNPPEELRGRISVLDDPREVIGAALLYNGHSINSKDRDELQQALETIQAAKPYWAAFVSDGLGDKVIGGDFAVSMWWSGGVGTVIEQAPGQIGYAIPREGANLFQENLCVLAGSENVEHAQALAEYLLRPEIAARNVRWLAGGTPMSGVIPLLPEALRNDPGMYPDAETMQQLHRLGDIGDAIRMWDQIWTAVKSS